MKDISYVNVFVASSINEFHKERMELGAFVQQMNAQMLKQGKYTKLYLCEDMSDAIAADKKRKQEEYNEALRGSQIFILLADRQIGEYTMEEFAAADKKYCETGNPHICVFFKKRPEAVQTDALKKFMELLDSKQYGYDVFETMDFVKQKLEEKILEVFGA